MFMRSGAVAARLAGAPDDELIAATRAGDMDAYAQLWLRHADAAARAARAITRIAEPDDLVSEAFESILQTIRRGGGPRSAFRPYLYSVIRNQAATWAQRAREVPVEDLEARHHSTAPDPAEATADRDTLAEVFRSLPDRWRSLLWYLEVEGMKPREIGELMGMSSNATSALIYRARAGLRQAWIDVHIRDPRRPAECRWVCEQAASGRRRSRADDERRSRHLDVCQGCVLVADDVERLRGVLRAVLLPIFLGSAGAAAFIVDTPAPASAAGIAGARVRPQQRTPVRHSAALGVAAGIAVVALVAAVGLAQAALPSGGADSRGVAPAVRLQTAAQFSQLVRQPGRAPRTPAEPEPAPAAPAPNPVPETPDEPAAEPAPAAGVAVAPAAVTAPVRPTPQPTPDPEPAPEPNATPVAAPLLDAPVATEVGVPDPIRGSGVPGALITLVSSTGAVLAQTEVGTDRRFTAILPGDLLTEGMVVTATQEISGLGISPHSAPVGPFRFQSPQLSTAAPTELVDADADGVVDDLVLELAGVPNSHVIVAVDGMWTGHTHILGDAPLLRHAPNLAPGDHTFTARYIDPSTGGLGVAVTIAVTALLPPSTTP